MKMNAAILSNRLKKDDLGDMVYKSALLSKEGGKLQKKRIFTLKIHQPLIKYIIRGEG